MAGLLRLLRRINYDVVSHLRERWPNADLCHYISHPDAGKADLHHREGIAVRGQADSRTAGTSLKAVFQPACKIGLDWRWKREQRGISHYHVRGDATVPASLTSTANLQITPGHEEKLLPDTYHCGGLPV